ncbi:MAG: 50S ribosomal protein L28, partial [Candidatus Omnitrophica bacterium]|nr:50S ribosomal protein L28 [Candidatus Omnitrophota bacterium]
LQKIRIKLDGRMKKAYICTKCLKKGKAKKR